jgi:hypothetical protein
MGTGELELRRGHASQGNSMAVSVLKESFEDDGNRYERHGEVAMANELRAKCLQIHAMT